MNKNPLIKLADMIKKEPTSSADILDLLNGRLPVVKITDLIQMEPNKRLNLLENGICLWIPNSGQEVGHYTFIGLRDSIITFFDPYGQPLKQLEHIPELFKILHKEGYQFKINKFELQPLKDLSINTCASWSVLFFVFWDIGFSLEQFINFFKANSYKVDRNQLVSLLTFMI